MDRRTFIRRTATWGAALGAAGVLPGCDPGRSRTVTVPATGSGPSIVNPFLFALQALVLQPDTALNIFYPSRTDGGPIVEDLGPYPLVAFFHGNCTNEVGTYRH